MSTRQEISGNGSVELHKDSDFVEEETTPKLLPTFLDMPTHQSSLSVSSTGSNMSTDSSLTALSDSNRSDVSMASAHSDTVVPTRITRTSSSGSDSDASQGSAITDASESIAAMITDDFRESVRKIIEKRDEWPLDTLIKVTERHLLRLKNISPLLRRLPTPDAVEERLDAYKIFCAMWDYALQRRGGRWSDHPIRYTAACIICCGDDVKQWIALANTWFGCFMWPFRASRHYEHGEFSQVATPTFENTAKAFSSDSSRQHRSKSMTIDVLRREDYTCPVTKQQTPKTSKKIGNRKWVETLECAHILKRSVAEYSTRDDVNALSTIDILRNYCPPMAWNLDALVDKFDSPSNGIALQTDTHKAFDNYRFCFLLVEGTDNTYKLKALKEGYLEPDELSREIVFKDNSHLHPEGAEEKLDVPRGRVTRSGNAGNAPRTVELADPYFLSIHAAIAHVLHASGAAEFIDSFLSLDSDSAGKPMKNTRDLEAAFMRVELTQSLAH